MRLEHVPLESGWCGVRIGLTPAEIDELLALLGDLRRGSIGHFHFTRRVWEGTPGVADVEFSLKAQADPDDARVG